MNIYQIETTNRCNASCSYCPHSKMTRPKGDMDIPTFLNCLSIMSNHYVALHHFGEPFLNSNLANFIAIANHNKIKVEFSTNGKVLEGLQEVMNQNPHMIRIAFDPFEPIEFIKSILTFNNETIIKLHSVDGKLEVKKPITNFAGAIKNIKSEVSGSCFFKKYDYVCVLYNGDIVPCCCDYDGKHILGNVNDNDMKGIKTKANYELCRYCAGMQFAEWGLWWNEI